MSSHRTGLRLGGDVNNIQHEAKRPNTETQTTVQDFGTDPRAQWIFQVFRWIHPLPQPVFQKVLKLLTFFLPGKSLPFGWQFIPKSWYFGVFVLLARRRRGFLCFRCSFPILRENLEINLPTHFGEYPRPILIYAQIFNIFRQQKHWSQPQFPLLHSRLRRTFSPGKSRVKNDRLKTVLICDLCRSTDTSDKTRPLD